MERFAAEEGKVRLGEAGHGELPGTESLILQLQLPVGGVVAVLAVAQDGAADAGHVGADLVGAASAPTSWARACWSPPPSTAT